MNLKRLLFLLLILLVLAVFAVFANSGLSIFSNGVSSKDAVSRNEAELNIPRTALPSDTAIGQVPQYTNVLQDYGAASSVSAFFPLDRGNSWKYRIETRGSTDERSHKIVAVADGWSIFDNFFGKSDVAMRINPSGEIYVSSGKRASTFYTPDVLISFEESDFSTPAGNFSDLMIVTIPENEKFWFKDIYAKDVGLIYHKHKSRKGNAEYTLIEAKVGGRNYP